MCRVCAKRYAYTIIITNIVQCDNTLHSFFFDIHFRVSHLFIYLFIWGSEVDGRRKKQNISFLVVCFQIESHGICAFHKYLTYLTSTESD